MVVPIVLFGECFFGGEANQWMWSADMVWCGRHFRVRRILGGQILCSRLSKAAYHTMLTRDDKAA
jgi:hypothetical protein